LTIKVCVSIPPKTVEDALNLIEKADAQHADIIEIRLDRLTNHDRIVDIPGCSNTPLIATSKSTEQHGEFSVSETERQRLLIDAAQKGFEYVDVDLDTPNASKLVSKLQDVGAKPIVSFHDFHQTCSLPELYRILEEEIALGADVCKIITTAKYIEDNLLTLDFVSKASNKTKIVCFAMGELGKLSRLLSPVFGAFFTFSAIDENRKTAKGQITIQEMRQAYRALGLK
jgi:3-dehydroquinate dehydratase type I